MLIWLFILAGILLPQLGLPGKWPKYIAWALLIAAVLLFVFDIAYDPDFADDLNNNR